MPSVSKKQQKFFRYLLSNPEERKKKGISKKDATDFAQHVKEGEIADKLRKVVADMKAADRKAGLLPGGKDVVDLDVERQRRRKKKVDESIERQAKDRKKLSQPHSVSGSRRDHSHDVDSALTDHVPRKGKGRIRPASKKEMRVSAMRDAGIKQEEVVYEVKTIRSKEDAEKMRQQKDNPDDWTVRNKGGGHWHPIHKDRLKGQRETRAKNLKPIKQKELEDHGKRNLHKDWKERAKKAIKIERSRKRAQEAERKQKQTETGKKHDVDHIQGQANRKKHSDRWHKIHPGDASDNRRVISQADNLKKNSKDSGEKKITRAKAVRLALDRARQNEELVYEVSPPGWGHTKAEKEKTKPWKPKSKIGGTAAAFKRALDDGRFKGLPGSKTKKEKTADMFKLMWSMEKKGDHPHYKPGTDKKYKKYQKNEEKQITSMQDNDLFGNAYERSGASWRISKKKKKKKTQSEEAQTRYWKDDPKTKKSWAQFTNSMRKAAANKAQSDKTAVDTAKRGVKFYDKKGSGRIVKGKKVYGAK